MRNWNHAEQLQTDHKLGNRIAKQLLNSVITKYRDLSVSRRSIIYLILHDILFSFVQ